MCDYIKVKPKIKARLTRGHCLWCGDSNNGMTDAGERGN